MKPNNFRRVDTSKPPTAWDVAYGAMITFVFDSNGELLVDHVALTVKPGAWPEIPAGYDFLVKSIKFSGTKD